MKKSEGRDRESELPFVLVNAAMTADGKIAFANGHFVSFSSQRDARHILELRATADAVICGAKTIATTRTVLGNGGERFRKRRLKNGLAEFPLRVVASGSGSVAPDAPIFQKRFSPVIVLTTERISEFKLKRLRAGADVVKICGGQQIDFRRAFRWLRSEWGVKRLLGEGGGELNGALFRAGLVDELHLTVCPRIFGGAAAPTLADGIGFRRLADAAQWQMQSFRRAGDEIFLVFQRRKTGG